ncbi:MAG TPA: nuclear transport factor 2 family protein [Thermoanaerobaculia bacterium]|jgi:ketosteroid isomerase-like protein|nr:nuclear transport factor 2 family protein [Thermoanaerobaculia bacterium]
MKRSFVLAIAFALMPLTVTAAGHVSAADLAAIRAVLDEQAAAWNRGDIDGYMAGYAQSDDTMFVGTDVTRGWTKVRDRYKAKYDSRAKMGTLVFSDLDLRPLGADDVIVTGAWKLTREADTPHGRFTLIFHRRPEGWRIVYDHSS